MPGRVILCGALADRYETERLLAERRPELHVDSVAQPWELAERAGAGGYDVALLLKGAITEHERRLDAIAGLRRGGFAGRILAAGAFLTEKQDAVRAGADYAFDPDKQATERVVAAAVLRPTAAADHPYLRHLFVGEWAEAQAYDDAPPRPAPDLILAATSCHPGARFWADLAALARENASLRAVIVEDGGAEEARTEALATGVQPYVVLATDGLVRVIDLARRFLREAWLARVSAA